MRWKRVPKNSSYQPASGVYSDWKELLSIEAEHLCVYCSIHESSMGGVRNFHVEHFRPKSKFENLVNIFSNLFYACPICNVFKSNDWPHEPDGDNYLRVICYPDPSIVNYADIFEVNLNTGLIEGKYTSAKYIQNKLYLNRPQLIIDRKFLILNDKMSSIVKDIELYMEKLSKRLDNPAAVQLLLELTYWLAEVVKIQSLLPTATPYKVADITKD
ncbi:MAG: HNH endonuclease [Legionella sp.]|nr:hypothetical protein [Chlorobiaceae bacterium]MDP3268981.1 HNH endonuclease [Legionella sp.]